MNAKIKQSVISLLLGRAGNKAAGAFFSAVALRLHIKASTKIDTFATNGKAIYYNEAYLDSITTEEVTGVLAHEVLHVANFHNTRRGMRDPKMWNIACDLAINSIIIDSGLRLPKDGVFAGVGKFASFPTGESAEKYYELLMQQGAGGGGGDQNPVNVGSGGGDQQSPDQQQDGDGDGKDEAKDGKPSEGQGSGNDSGPSMDKDTGGLGGVLDADKNDEGDIMAVVETAKELAKSQGNMPGGLRQLLESRRSVVDWRAALQNLLKAKAKSDYTYRRPSRRSGGGCILPVQGGYKVPRTAVLLDTSGSIGSDILAKFTGEIEAFRKEAKCDLVLIPHHVNAYSVAEVDSDQDLVLPRLQSGGTCHCDAISKAVEMEAELIVSLTDCESSFPADPGVDVIWVRHNTSSHPASPPSYGSLVDIVE